MLEGEPPYSNESESTIILELIKTNGKPYLKQETISNASKDILNFLDRCLTLNPQQRADTKELLNHEFILQAGSLSLLEPNVIKAKLAGQHENEKVLIYENESLVILDERFSGDLFRYLAIQNETDESWQGMISLEKPNEIYIDCLKAMMGSMLIETKPNKVLIIGLGIGILTKALDKILDRNASIHVVEINPLMPQLANEYFYFKPSERVTICIEDGFNYIMSLLNSQLFDLIFLDAFAEGLSIIYNLI